MLGRIKFALVEDVMLEVAMDQLPVYKGGENAGVKDDEQVSSLVRDRRMNVIISSIVSVI